MDNTSLLKHLELYHSYNIFCARCYDYALEDNDSNADIMVMRAYDLGWRSVNGRALCPTCQKKGGETSETQPRPTGP